MKSDEQHNRWHEGGDRANGDPGIFTPVKWKLHHENLLIHMPIGTRDKPDTTPRDCGCDCPECKWWTRR